MSDYIMTVDSDVEDLTSTLSPVGSLREDDANLDPDFVFNVSGDPYVDFSTKAMEVEDLVKPGSKPVRFFFSNFHSDLYNWFQSATGVS